MRGTRRVNWSRLGERGVIACYGGEGNGVSAHKRATWAHRRVSVRGGGGGGGGNGVSAH